MTNPTIIKSLILKKWWFWVIIFFLFIIIFSSISDNPQPKNQDINQPTMTRQEVEYKIVEEMDISYLGCKRIGIKMIVPDDSDKRDVRYTSDKIIDQYKSKWNDITIWAYKYSEENQTDGIYTMGIQEYSICE